MKEEVGDMSREDLLQLGTTISIVRSVAQGPTDRLQDGHFGLGVPVALKKVFDIGDCGMLTVGTSGVGKTATIMALRSLLTKKLYDKEKTMASIGKRKEKGDEGMDPGDQEFFTGSAVTWISYDFAKLSEMAIVNILKIVCALLTEHEIKAGTMSYDLNITNCRLSWFGACTYEAYDDLWETSQWRGNFKDRIARAHQMIYRRPFANENYPAPSVKIDHPTIEGVELGDLEGHQMVTDMLRSQFTAERAPIWASRLGKASAALNGRKSTTWADWKFLLLNRLDFEAEKMVGYRAHISARLMMDVDALMILSETMKVGETTPGQIMDDYNITDSEMFNQTLRECLSGEFPLLEKAPGGKIRPGEVLLHDYILPKQAFEIFCLHRGKEYEPK